MQTQGSPSVSGHVYLKPGKRGDVWYYRARFPREVRKHLGPAWSGNGRLPAGFFTRKTAQATLDAILTDARRGTLPGTVATGSTFADASAAWLAHAKQFGHAKQRRRPIKPSTAYDYTCVLRHHLDPAFGSLRLEAIAAIDIERWQSRLLASGSSRRTINKATTILYGVFEHARRTHPGLVNPTTNVDKFQEHYDEGRFDFYSREEVWALARAAASEQDGTLFLTAAFTGLRRGELIALRVRDVDFELETVRVERSRTPYGGETLSPKSGKVRSVPMVEPVAVALAKLLQRERFTEPDDLLFPNCAGDYQDATAIRERFVKARDKAGLKPLRFHDLRHTFGSIAINAASVFEVQNWLGHADISTTQRYVHYRSRAGEAARLAPAFSVAQPEQQPSVVEARGALAQH